MSSLALKASASALSILATTSFIANTQTVAAEEVVAQPTRRSLPIYDAAVAPAILVPTPSPLQDEVATARRVLRASVETAQAHAREAAQTWIGWEGTAEAHLKALLPHDEQLTPGALYVGVATLAGSILARNRTILLRATLPPAFFLFSLAHFLPQTASNLGEHSKVLEARFAPGLTSPREKVQDWFRQLR